MASDPDALIPALYDAAVEPEHWPDVLRRLSELTGNTAAYLCHVPMSNPAGGYTWLHEFDPVSVEAWKRAHAGPHYAGTRACIVNPVGTLIDRRAIADDKTFLADPGHVALLGSQGLFHGQLSPVFRDGGTLSALLCFRDRKRGPMEEAAIDFLKHLLPHFTRAVGIHQRMARLEGDVALLSGALDAIVIGVVTLSSEMRVTFANPEADRILRLNDGIGQSRGKLALSNLDQHNYLLGLVKKCESGALGSENPYIFVKRPSGAADYTLFVSPHRGAAHNADWVHNVTSAATIFLTDPATPTALPSVEQLAKRFGLTATEAEVARLVAAGRGMPYAASVLSISLNTARTHLKSIYSKLDINHQASLVRLVKESFPPTRSHDPIQHGAIRPL